MAEQRVVCQPCGFGDGGGDIAAALKGENTPNARCLAGR